MCCFEWHRSLAVAASQCKHAFHQAKLKARQRCSDPGHTVSGLPHVQKPGMSTSQTNIPDVDGRTITVPVTWFPRLAYGTESERANWRLIGGGHGIHWPDLDEDLSVESLLTGRRSPESESSLTKWMVRRNCGR